MANHALFLGWNRPSIGREQHAMKLWEKTMEYYGKLQADKRIESFEPVLLSAHGGDLNGFILIRGDREKLNEIRNDNTFLNFTIEAEYCLEDFGIISAFIGESLADLFTRWTKHIGS